MNKAVFLDRDGVINKLVDRGNGEFTSPHRLEEVEYYPKVDEAITILRELGFKLLCVTNQPGIAYGNMSIYDCVRICDSIKFRLRLDEVYPCIFPTAFVDMPDHDYKPGCGAIKKLIKKWNIGATGNFTIGDRWKDIVAGYRAGVFPTIYVNEKAYHCPDSRFDHIYPSFQVSSLYAAADLIKRIENLELPNG